MMKQSTGMPGDSGSDGTWAVRAAEPGSSVRCAAPAELCEEFGEIWVEVRPLTYREALVREALGVTEHYELTEGGAVLGVCRRYDLVAMAAYDVEHCLVDYCLPIRLADGKVTVVRKTEGGRQASLRLLDALPLRVGEWLRECLDRVNLRDRAGQLAMETAQKK